MDVTAFLIKMQKELLGTQSEDLRGRQIVFESMPLDERKGRHNVNEKEVTYWGQIVGVAHRRGGVTRPGLEDAEFFELMLADPQARLTKNSTSEAWVLRFGGDTYLGRVRME